jgi:hypothetical protein
VSRYCPSPGRTVIAAAAFVALLSAIPSTPLSAQGDHLVLNYQPSQPTGWAGGNNMSIGGHTPSLEFTHGGETWRISLVSFGQPGDAPDPIYEDVPGDPTINFDQVLTNTFGDYYSFNYVGGLRGQDRFTVLSYNVFVKEPTPMFPVTNFGGEVYVVYDPGGSEAVPMNKPLQWIQTGNATQIGSFLDYSWRANPFYIIGGLTSIYGRQVVNFHDASQQFRGPGPQDLTSRWTGEAFLVQDTGIKDLAGKEIVNIFGGFKWGWEVERATSSTSFEHPGQRSATLTRASLQH